MLTMLSTWRTLVPTLEDRPLALCDSRSVEPKDLVAADRIIPDRVGEVYYLTHNPKHRWYAAAESIYILTLILNCRRYWLEKQTPAEPFVFVMYDTKNGEHARCEFPIL
jgi:hypothetical protein